MVGSDKRPRMMTKKMKKLKSRQLQKMRKQMRKRAKSNLKWRKVSTHQKSLQR